MIESFQAIEARAEALYGFDCRKTELAALTLAQATDDPAVKHELAVLGGIKSPAFHELEWAVQQHYRARAREAGQRGV